jgi:hypothetical protein
MLITGLLCTNRKEVACVLIARMVLPVTVATRAPDTLHLLQISI